jgi:hypothetical protein
MGPSKELDISKSPVVADYEDLILLLFCGEMCVALEEDQSLERWELEGKVVGEMEVGQFEEGALAKVSRR